MNSTAHRLLTKTGATERKTEEEDFQGFELVELNMVELDSKRVFRVHFLPRV